MNHHVLPKLRFGHSSACGLGRISRDRERGGPTAPACGLYLTALSYGMENIDVNSVKK